MLIVAPNEPRQVTAWRWPFGQESELVSAAKRLSEEKRQRLNFLVDQFSNAIILGEFTRAIPDMKTFDQAVERFEVIANPIISAAMTLEEELRELGIEISYDVDDPLTGKRSNVGNLYMSLFDLAKKAKAWWKSEKHRRAIVSAMVSRMKVIQNTIDTVSGPFVSPDFIDKIKGMKPAPTAPPTAAPTAPEAPAKTRRKVPYFAGTGDEEKKSYQAKSKSDLRNDVLDAIRANRNRLPDDLKAGVPGLISFFTMMSKIKTAGFLENVYEQRKNDIRRLLKRFYKGDYDRVKNFEEGVLSWLEQVWNVEDFPEADPHEMGIDPVDYIINVAREMTDRGDPTERVVDEISKMLMRETGGREFRLNDIVNKRPHFFASSPEFAEAIEKTRKEIKGTLSAPAPAAVPSMIPKAAPKTPTPAPVPSTPAPTPAPSPASPAPAPKLPGGASVLKPGEAPASPAPRRFKPPRKPTTG